MWFVHYTLPLSLNYGGLICFLALLPRSFVLFRAGALSSRGKCRYFLWEV